MTVVHVDLRRPQAETTDRLGAGGSLDVSLYRRQAEGDHFTLVTAFAQILVDGQTDLSLTPNDGTNAWVINERVRDGSVRMISVPDSNQVLQYVDLPTLDPRTLEPTDEVIAAWEASTALAIAARDAARAAADSAEQYAEGSLQVSLNLSDLTNPQVARTSLGLGSAAVHDATDFDPSGAATQAQTAAASDATTKANAAQTAAASDATTKANAAQTAAVQRANHTGTQPASTVTGLAPVATSGAYSDLTGVPSAVDISGKADKSANLSDLASAPTARTNLGLGSAATQPSSAFEPAGLSSATATTLSSTYVTKTSQATVTLDGLDKTGTTDCAAAINAALSLLNTSGRGGTLVLPAGTLALASTITLYSNVAIRGMGLGTTVLKPLNGTNLDAVLKSYQFDSLTGGGTSGGTVEIALADFTIDGNRANNPTGGAGIKMYGAINRWRDILVRNCPTDGIYSEWSSSAVLTDGCESHLDSVVCHDNGNRGFAWAGSHDSIFRACIAFLNSRSSVGTYAGFDMLAGGSITIAIGCHSWGVTQGDAWTLRHTVHLIGSQGEGGLNAEVRILGSGSQITGGRYFGNANQTPTAKAFVLGSSTVTAYNTNIDTETNTCNGGVVDFSFSGGGNVIKIRDTSAGGSNAPSITGTPNSADEFYLHDVVGSLSQYKLPGATSITTSSTGALVSTRADAVETLRLDNANKNLKLENGTALSGYSDTGTSTVWNIVSGVANLSAVRDQSKGLGTGDSTMTRLEAQSLSITPISGDLLLSYFTATRTESVNNLRMLCATAGGAPTYAAVGLYSVDGSGNLTLIGSSASDTALFTSAAAYTKALTATAVKNNGGFYAIGVLIVSSNTMPKLVGSFPAGGVGSELALGRRLTGHVSGQSALPSSITAGSVSGTGAMVYAAATP